MEGKSKAVSVGPDCTSGCIFIMSLVTVGHMVLEWLLNPNNYTLNYSGTIWQVWAVGCSGTLALWQINSCREEWKQSQQSSQSFSHGNFNNDSGSPWQGSHHLHCVFTGCLKLTLADGFLQTSTLIKLIWKKQGGIIQLLHKLSTQRLNYYTKPS